MTDRELLELAAKAAGIDIHWSDTYDGFLTKNSTGYWEFLWNPLEDDGDALRLAVKLGMIIGTYANYSTVDCLFPNNRIETITVWHSSYANDPQTSTRHAIVMAAAEIGKSMGD